MKNKSTLIYACLVCLSLAVLNFIAEIGIALYMNNKFAEINRTLLNKQEFREDFLQEIANWPGTVRVKRDDVLNVEKICEDIDETCPPLHGPRGFHGIKGIPGYPGIPGPVGPVGPIGESKIGEKGSKGEKGEKGGYYFPASCKQGQKGRPGKSPS